MCTYIKPHIRTPALLNTRFYCKNTFHVYLDCQYIVMASTFRCNSKHLNSMKWHADDK